VVCSATTIHFVVYHYNLRRATPSTVDSLVRHPNVRLIRLLTAPLLAGAVHRPRTPVAFFPALAACRPRAVAAQALPTTRRRTKFHFQMQAVRDYDDDDGGGYSVCCCHEAVPRAMTRFVTGS